MSKQEFEPVSTREDFARFRAEIYKGINYAQNTRQLNLIYIQYSEQLALLRIIQDGHGRNFHFAEVIPRSTITIGEITQPNKPQGANDPNKPWEMLLESPLVSLEQTMKNIVSFIHYYYGEIEGLTINVYDKSKSFIKQQKLAELHPDNNLTLYAA